MSYLLHATHPETVDGRLRHSYLLTGCAHAPAQYLSYVAEAMAAWLDTHAGIGPYVFWCEPQDNLRTILYASELG